MINATGNRMTAEIRRQGDLARSIERSQIAISTGKRLQTASDDPVAAQRIGAIRQMQADDVAWSRTIGLATSLTDQADGVMTSLSDRMARVQELVTSAGNPGLAQVDRDTIAAEMRAIAEEIDGLADTRSSLGPPLFAPGNALAFRFDAMTVFAPVPSRNQVFESNGTSLADMVRGAADAVATGDPIALAGALAAVDQGVSHVADQAAQIGLNAARIARLDEARAGRGIGLAEERSSLEDTDLTEAIARLNAEALTLQAAQAAFARINRQTLFDILR